MIYLFLSFDDSLIVFYYTHLERKKIKDDFFLIIDRVAKYFDCTSYGHHRSDECFFILLLWLNLMISEVDS